MNIYNYRHNIIFFVFTLAVFSLGWRYGNVEITYIPKPFEILIATTFLLIVLEFLFLKETRAFVYQMKHIWKLYGLLFLGLIVFMGISTFFSLPSILISSIIIKKVFFEYVRIIFVLFSFFITTYVVFRYKDKLKWFLYALTISSFLFYLSIFSGLRDFFVENNRLIGAYGDPNYTASFIGLGLLISAVYYLYSETRLRWFGILSFFFLVPLFVWSNSRGNIISFGIVFLLLFIFYFFMDFSRRRFWLVFFLLSISVLASSIAFSLLPEDSRASIYRRSIAPIISTEYVGDTNKNYIANFDNEYLLYPIDNFTISRGNLWKSAFIKTIKNPLGLGPAYHNWEPIEPGAVSHNFLFQISLTFGWGGFFIWLILIGTVIKSSIQIFRENNFIGVALSSCLAFLLAVGIFFDMLTVRWLWLIMGLIVGYAFLENDKEKTNSIDTAASL